MANALEVIADGQRILVLAVDDVLEFTSERALGDTTRMLPPLMKQRRTELLGVPRGIMRPSANNELDAGARWTRIWSQPA